MSQCQFQIAWVGRCKNYCVTNNDSMCQEHSELTCCSCGKPATKQCDHTGGLVCGANLCDGCKHSPPEKSSKNWFGMGGSHKSEEQADKEWSAYYDNW